MRNIGDAEDREQLLWPWPLFGEFRWEPSNKWEQLPSVI